MSYFEGDCHLTPVVGDDKRGTCARCDPAGDRPLPLGTHRLCGQPKSPRELVEARLQQMVDVGAATRTIDKIYATLDKCFGGCRHFNGHTCTRRGCVCRHYKNWLISIIAADCDQYRQRPVLTNEHRGLPEVGPRPGHYPEVAVAITTAPRRGPALLERCVGSVLDAGFVRPLICAEPGSAIPPAVEDVAGILIRSARLGCWQNWLQTLQDVLERSPAAEAILMVQDDAELSGGVVDFLKVALWPSSQCGVLSLYLSALYSAQPMGVARLNDGEAKWLVGACALLFPRHGAHQVVAYGRAHGWQGHPKKTIVDPVRKVGVDAFVGRAVTALGYEFWAVNPSLVNHDATHSTVGHGGSEKNRAPHDWIGRRGDPLDHIRDRPARVALPSDRPVAVIIPMAGECSDLMSACIDHLARNAGTPFRLIVVDNGTPGNVGEAVDAAADGLDGYQRIRLPENLGFTVACNRGIQSVEGRDVLLLNSDCRLAPNCLPLLVHALTRRGRIAAVGPLTLDNGDQSLARPGRLQQARLARLPVAPVDQVALVRSLPSNDLHDEVRLAFFCVLLNRSAIRDVGLLDGSPAFASGLGVDDEWCRHARERGWDIVTHSGAYADHDHGATFRRLGLDRVKMQAAARVASDNRADPETS